MNVLAVGMSHRTAAVRELERAAVSPQQTGKLLAELLDCANVSEVVLLSTCNRVEVYAVVETFHGGLADVTTVLARHTGADPADLSGSLYVHYSAAAVEHLFAVAAGLDSMVVGEAQILGQLRNAYATADETGTVGRVLHELVQYALRVGKRVHTETDIDHVGASVVGEALTDASTVLLAARTSPGAPTPPPPTASSASDSLDFAAADAVAVPPTAAADAVAAPPAASAAAFAGLAGRRAVVVGAGAMGGLAAAALRRAGIGQVVVVNRTTANGQRLAASLADAGVSARAAGLDALVAELGASDLVVACTGSNDVVVSVDMVAAATVGKGSPLVVCDLGLPRDVDPEVGSLPGVTLVNLDTLRERLLNAPAGLAAKVGHQIVADEVRGYLAAQRSAAVTPTVTALRKRAAEVVDAELLRLDAKLPGLDPQVRSELSRTVRRVVDKLLHSPTVRVKQLASAPGGSSYADALRELFELDPQTAAIISSPQQEEK